MRKGSSADVLEAYVRIPRELHKRLEPYKRRFPRRSMNMLIVTAIELYVKKLEEAESKTVTEG